MLLSDFLNFVKFGDLDNVIQGIKEGIDPSVSNNWPILLAHTEAKKLNRRTGIKIEDTPSYKIILYLWQYPQVREKLIYLCNNLDTEETQFIVNFPTKITYQKTQIEEILDDDEEEEEDEYEYDDDEDEWLDEGGWSDLERERLRAKQLNPFGF
jgi:hypothetical protein